METEKASVDRELRALRASVDASAVSESRLREILAQAIGDITEDRELLLTMVYRVEVAKDTVTIWTLLDADPNGDIDINQEGVTTTVRVPSGVPKIPDTHSGAWNFLYTEGLERSNPNMPVAYCCHQFKNWWLPLFLPQKWGRNANEYLLMLFCNTTVDPVEAFPLVIRAVFGIIKISKRRYTHE